MPSVQRSCTVTFLRRRPLPLFLNNQSYHLPYDGVPITFVHYRHIKHTIADHEPRQTVSEFSFLRAEDTFLVPRHLLSNMTSYTILMTDFLSNYLQPRDACTMAESIYDKLIHHSHNFSTLPIVLKLKDVVNITYVTSEDDELIAWVLRELDDEEDDDQVIYNFIPATKSAIEGLEHVRLADMEKQSWSCVICMEAGFEGDHGDGGQPLDLLRLPCLHLYHGHCIVRWLETNHLCPLCRYKMPNVLRQSNFKLAN